nr:hypothetical protein [Tanacetum cinerariifolium]
MAAIDDSMKAQLKGKGSTHNEFQASSKPPWNEETNFDGDALWWVKKHNHRNHIKTEFPRFNEEDLRGWILKVEIFLTSYELLNPILLLGDHLSAQQNQFLEPLVGHSRGALEFEQKVGHSRGAPK